MMTLFGCQCRGCGCCHSTSLPVTDPQDEGTWVPSGTWPNVTWSFVPNQGDKSGNTWYFYRPGLQSGQKASWYDPCNWYSRLELSPSEPTAPAYLTCQANRLPPDTATVIVFSPMSYVDCAGNVDSTLSVEARASRFYFFNNGASYMSVLARDFAHNSDYGTVFCDSYFANQGSVAYGALFVSSNNWGGVYNGARFINSSNQRSYGVSGKATSTNTTVDVVFEQSSTNWNSMGFDNPYAPGRTQYGVQGYQRVRYATKFNNSLNSAQVYFDGYFENGATNNHTGYGNATFNDSYHGGSSTTSTTRIYGDATFAGASATFGLCPPRDCIASVIEGNATFSDTSIHRGDIYGTATFSGSAVCETLGVVYGNATFQDAACAKRVAVVGGVSKFQVNKATGTGATICSGTAPTYATAGSATCGCG